VREIRNSNIETPAFAEAASRRQAKHLPAGGQESQIQMFKFPKP
jgi:hypothetical protein